MGEQRLFTEFRYSIMFKSYRILKFAILAGSLIKKCGKFEFSGISGKLELVCQSLLNQAEIFTSPSLHKKKSVVKELWNFKNWRFYANFSLKFCQKSLKVVKIGEIFMSKWHKIANELQNSITSEQNWISSFSKKSLVLLEEFSEISSTWFFWLWPPYCLKGLHVLLMWLLTYLQLSVYNTAYIPHSYHHNKEAKFKV